MDKLWILSHNIGTQFVHMERTLGDKLWVNWLKRNIRDWKQKHSVCYSETCASRWFVDGCNYAAVSPFGMSFLKLPYVRRVAHEVCMTKDAVVPV